MTDNNPYQFLDLKINPKTVEAQLALQNHKIPESAVRTRQARGGKPLSYIDHVYATETVQRALPPTWSFKVRSYEYFEDNSVLAICSFKFYMPYTSVNGTEWVEREVAEIGSFINDRKMVKAFAISSAVSRGFVRCLMRMFGFGIEFYKNKREEDNEDVTPEQAWAMAVATGASLGINQEKVLEIMKSIGVWKDNIADEFQHLWEALNEHAKKARLEPFPAKEAMVPDNGSAPKEQYYTNWSDVHLWLADNGINSKDAAVKLMENPMFTKPFNVAEVPMMHKELKRMYNLN